MPRCGVNPALGGREKGSPMDGEKPARPQPAEAEDGPKITLSWGVDRSPSPADRARLLEILFEEDEAA